MSNPTDRVLPDAFITGDAIVDDEHRHLRQQIERLRSICAEYETRQTCQGCASEKISRCESVLLECISDLLAYMVDHFRAEENLMKRRGINQAHRERYLVHTEDHADIANHVAQLTHPRDPGLTVKTIAETTALISHWLDRHIVSHDVPMLH